MPWGRDTSVSSVSSTCADDDSSHVRITIYVGTCSLWFLKPSGAKDNGREKRSAEPARRIAREMREKDHKERRMDRQTWWIRRSRGSSSLLQLIDSGSWLAGGLSASSRSLIVLFFSLYERRHENTQALVRELPPGGGGADPSTWVALACRGLIRF